MVITVGMIISISGESSEGVKGSDSTDGSEGSPAAQKGEGK